MASVEEILRFTKKDECQLKIKDAGFPVVIELVVSGVTYKYKVINNELVAV